MNTRIILDIRAAASTYVVFALLFGPICFFSIAVYREYSTTILFSLVLAFIFTWIRKFRIVVDDATLSYSSLFGGRQSVQLNEIVSARTEIGTRRALDPMYRMVLELEHSAGKSPIIINMKVFRRKDIAGLVAILRDKMAEQPRLSLFKSKNHL